MGMNDGVISPSISSSVLSVVPLLSEDPSDIAAIRLISADIL